jgi:hypothetical protein
MRKLTTYDKELLKYLRGVRQLRVGMGPLPKGILYAGPEDFCLMHGVSFTPAPLPKQFTPMLENYCFDNVYKFVRRYPEYHYVEGYASWGVFPMMHAWAIDAEGTVIDPTWTDAIRKYRRKLSYFGVELNMDAVARSRKHDSTSVLGDWKGPALTGEDVRHHAPFFPQHSGLDIKLRS